MGKRKIKVFETAATAVAEIAWFIESQGFPQTAEKFVDEVFDYFETLADDIIEHKPCTHEKWKDLNYRCVIYKRKYVIAYLSLQKEIVICDFVSSKLLK